MDKKFDALNSQSRDLAFQDEGISDSKVIFSFYGIGFNQMGTALGTIRLSSRVGSRLPLTSLIDANFLIFQA